MNLRSIDLNLLVVLEVLLEEKSVTQAARRLFVSQSAMSQSLGKLREILGDPLLARHGNRLLPTPFAKDLMLPLRRLLADMQALLARRLDYDPKTSTRRFKVAMTDHVGWVILPSLMDLLMVEAPRCIVDFSSPQIPNPAWELDQGSFDLILGFFFEDPALQSECLFRDRFVTLLRPEHPWLSDLSVEGFCAYGHIVMSPHGEGRGMVDYALDKLKLERMIALKIPNFSLGPPVLQQTDLLMTLPLHLARKFSGLFGLVWVETPAPMDPFEISIGWCPRYANEPGLLWMRELMLRAARESDVESLDL